MPTQDLLLYLQIAATTLPVVQAIVMLLAAIVVWMQSLYVKARERRHLHAKLAEFAVEDEAALLAFLTQQAKDPKQLWKLALKVRTPTPLIMHLFQERQASQIPVSITHMRLASGSMRLA